MRHARDTQFYLSKEAESMTKMTEIAELYPDATFSRCQAVNIAKKLRDCQLQLKFLNERIPEARQIRLPYGELCRDVSGIVAHIYDPLHIPLPPVHSAAAQPSPSHENEGRGYTYRIFASGRAIACARTWPPH